MPALQLLFALFYLCPIHPERGEGASVSPTVLGLHYTGKTPLKPAGGR